MKKLTIKEVGILCSGLARTSEPKNPTLAQSQVKRECPALRHCQTGYKSGPPGKQTSILQTTT
jgi:hypothetical protein